MIWNQPRNIIQKCFLSVHSLNGGNEWAGAALMESFEPGAHSPNRNSQKPQICAVLFSSRNQLARSLKGLRICVGVAAKRSWKSGEKAALFRTRTFFPDEGFSRNLQRREYRCAVRGGGAGWKVSAPCWARQLSRGVEWRLCTRSLLVGLRKRGWTHPQRRRPDLGFTL